MSGNITRGSCEDEGGGSCDYDDDDDCDDDCDDDDDDDDDENDGDDENDEDDENDDASTEGSRPVRVICIGLGRGKQASINFKSDGNDSGQQGFQAKFRLRPGDFID